MDWYDVTAVAPRQGRSRPRRAATHVHDAGNQHFRGGQIWAIAGDNIQIRLMLEANFTGYRVVDRALFTAAGMTVTLGDAVVCDVEGTGAGDYVVVRVRPGTFGDFPPHGDQAGAVAAGLFFPSILNGVEGTGISIYQDGTNSVFDGRRS